MDTRLASLASRPTLHRSLRRSFALLATRILTNGLSSADPARRPLVVLVPYASIALLAFMPLGYGRLRIVIMHTSRPSGISGRASSAPKPFCLRRSCLFSTSTSRTLLETSRPSEPIVSRGFAPYRRLSGPRLRPSTLDWHLQSVRCSKPPARRVFMWPSWPLPSPHRLARSGSHQ